MSTTFMIMDSKVKEKDSSAQLSVKYKSFTLKRQIRLVPVQQKVHLCLMTESNKISVQKLDIVQFH